MASFILKYILFVPFIGSSLFLGGQQLPSSLRLADLPLTYNIAATPTENKHQLLMCHQSQFIGGRIDLSNSFAATYQTASLGRNKNWGLGFHVLRDKAQDFYQTNVRAGVRVGLLDKQARQKLRFTWSLGGFWGLLFSRFDHSKTAIAEAGDEVLATGNNLNEMDAGIATQFKVFSGDALIEFGAAVVQLPQNWASNGERGLSREPHAYFTATALFSTGPRLKCGPAFAFHWLQQGDFGVPDYLQRDIVQVPAAQQFVELGCRMRLEKYQSGAYLAYRYGAKMLTAGFDTSIISINENRQRVSLAIHMGIPFGESHHLGPRGELALLWEWN